ncbi:hypothetical protein AAHC03_09951 [Spirometra sp. Aus1]
MRRGCYTRPPFCVTYLPQQLSKLLSGLPVCVFFTPSQARCLASEGRAERGLSNCLPRPQTSRCGAPVRARKKAGCPPVWRPMGVQTPNLHALDSSILNVLIQAEYETANMSGIDRILVSYFQCSCRTMDELLSRRELLDDYVLFNHRYEAYQGIRELKNTPHNTDS